MKDTKRRLMTFTFYDRTGIEKDLEKQAAKGWLLEKCAATGWIYRRIEPAKIHFAVVYFPAISIFDPEPSEKQKRFQDFCEHTGWELIATNAQMQIFCNHRENPIPIETEPAIEVENIHRSVKKTLLPPMVMNLFLAVMQLGLTYSRFSQNPLSELANLTSLISTVFWIMMIFSAAAQLLLYYRWLFKARKAAKNGYFQETRSTDRFQIIMSISTYLALVFMLASYGGWKMAIVGHLEVIAIIGTSFLMVKVTNHLKKKKVSAKVNQLVTYGMAVVFGLIICGFFLYFMVSINMQDRYDSDRADPYEYDGWTYYIYHDEIPLRIEDLVETDYEDYSYEMITDNSSPLLSLKEARQRHMHDGRDEPEMLYRIVEVKATWLYDFVLTVMQEDFDHNHAYPEDDPNWEEHRPLNPGPWGASNVYQLILGGEPYFRYLLCYDNCIIEIDLDWEPTEKEMTVIADKLLP